MKKSVELVLHALDSTDSFSNEEKEERLGPFLVRDISGHRVNINLSPSVEKMTITDTNGLLMETFSLESLDDMTVNGEILKYGVSDKDQKSPTYAGMIYLMKDKPDGGCSIISDIDDTIKISEVTDKKKLMVNTFKKDFTAVPGRECSKP